MRIVFLGSGEFGCESIKWLVGSSGRKHQVLEVITQPARQAGRGRKMHPTPIASVAEELNLPYRQSENVNNHELVDHITSLEPEILLVIAFGQKIGTALLNLPNCRVINLHGSLLPKYRGAAPINWAIINGEKQTGLTVIEVNEFWDAGNILGQVATEIKPQETAGELHDRLAIMGPHLVGEVLEKIAQGTDAPLIQDDSLACRAPKLEKNDGKIRWNQGVRGIRNFIHGMWPWPGAFCQLQQKAKTMPERVCIGRAEVISECADETTEPPGTVTEDMSIICRPGKIKLLEIRPDNSKLMDFAAFVNGRRLQPGDRFLDG